MSLSPTVTVIWQHAVVLKPLYAASMWLTVLSTW